MCTVALLAGLLAAAAPLVQAETAAAFGSFLQDEPPPSRRQLLQDIDPQSNPLGTSLCVKDTTVLPFSAVGKTVSVTSQGEQRCMAVLIASDAVLTTGVCLETNKSASFLYGGSECSQKQVTGRTVNVTSIFKSSTPSNCGSNSYAACQQQYNYAVAKLAEKFPGYLNLATEDTTSDTTVNIAGWAGM